MAGNRITWNIGRYNPDTHYVYRSDAPMDPNSLPTPIATLGQGVSVYEDTNNIVEGNTYYYRVDAEKMGLYIPGYEIQYVTFAFDKFNDNSTIAVYRFDNSVVDKSGNHSGTWSGTEQYANGIIDQAVDIDSSSYINLTPDVIPFEGSFSISCFVNADYLDSNSDNGAILARGRITTGNVNYGFAFSTSSSGLQIWRFSASGVGGTLTVSDTITTGTFYHTVVTYDYSTGIANLYLDKSNVGTKDISNDPLGFYSGYDGGVFRIGDYSSLSGFAPFNGKIDMMRIFNRVLTQTEVNELYQERFGA